MTEAEPYIASLSGTTTWLSDMNYTSASAAQRSSLFHGLGRPRSNDTLKREYHDWYKAAPKSYKRPIFETGLPMFIIVQYGQNRLIWNGKPEEEDALAGYWRREFDFTKLARLAIAVPVHYR